jgi:hypothetical protein
MSAVVFVVFLVFLLAADCGAYWTHDTTVGTVFSPRSGHSAVLFENQYAVIYGGHVLNGFEAPVDYFPREIWTFSRSSNSMTLTTVSGTVPSNRTFHGAVAISDREMLIWGGGSIEGFTFAPLADMWVYNRTSAVWTQRFPGGSIQPTGRLGHAMVRRGNQIFMFGGIVTQSNGDCCAFLNDMFSYSISGNQWTLLSPTGSIPSARGHAGVVVHGIYLWLQGGEGADFSIEHGLYMYNTVFNNWTLANQGDPDVNQRESQMFSTLGNSLICFAGDGEGENFYNLKSDTQIFFSGSWTLQSTPVQPPTAKRMPSVQFEDPDQVWFFGGNTDLNPFTFVESNHNELWYWIGSS